MGKTTVAAESVVSKVKLKLCVYLWRWNVDWPDYSQQFCSRGADKGAVLHAVLSAGLNLFLGAGAGAVNIICLTCGCGCGCGCGSFFLCWCGCGCGCGWKFYEGCGCGCGWGNLFTKLARVRVLVRLLIMTAGVGMVCGRIFFTIFQYFSKIPGICRG